MRLITFELKGSIAHFRKPDTTVTHSTYPFITRTALHGLVGSILGLKKLEGDNWFGLSLEGPVTTSFQQMSMLGKGWISSGGTFNRPTTIELLVNPNYKIFYAGSYSEKLKNMLVQNESVYHTYLGSAFCLTTPRLIADVEAEEIEPKKDQVIETRSIVPLHVVNELKLYDNISYSRAGGIRYSEVDNRIFDGNINYVYEVNGENITFTYKMANYPPTRFAQTNKEVVCLW